MVQPRVTAGERGALWLTELRLPGARPIAAAKGDTFLTLLEPPNGGVWRVHREPRAERRLCRGFGDRPRFVFPSKADKALSLGRCLSLCLEKLMCGEGESALAAGREQEPALKGKVWAAA